MVCNVWEEKGLLFSSGELSETESVAFKEHLTVCTECSEEFTTYQYCKNSFFTTNVLVAQPSVACDAEIIRVCSDGRWKMTGVLPISLIVKRTVVSLALLVIGFISVAYISVKISTPVSNTAQLPVQPTTVVTAVDSASSGMADSLNDSTQINSVNFANSRGNLDLKGVHSVDLQNK